MGISVIIPHYPFNEGINETLRKCIKSLSGYDELIVVVNQGEGFAKAVNRGLSLAKGDYLMVVNNDIEWVRGNLKELCIPNVVTSPTVNGGLQQFWGCFFCVPRTVYEKIGGLDEQFGIGFYEDDDYIKRLEQAGIEMMGVGSCDLRNKGGETMKQFDTVSLMKENKAKFDAKWN